MMMLMQQLQLILVGQLEVEASFTELNIVGYLGETRENEENRELSSKTNKKSPDYSGLFLFSNVLVFKNTLITFGLKLK